MPTVLRRAVRVAKSTTRKIVLDAAGRVFRRLGPEAGHRLAGGVVDLNPGLHGIRSRGDTAGLSDRISDPVIDR